jgi:hypothetical protein
MLQGAFVPVNAANGTYALMVSGPTDGNQGLPIETSIPVVTRSTSIMDSGKVAAPAAGGIIAATAALAQGTWELNFVATIVGTTVAATEVDNMEIYLNGVATDERIIIPVPGTSGAVGNGELKMRYDGAGIVSVRANAAATAGSTYACTIVATRVN